MAGDDFERKHVEVHGQSSLGRGMLQLCPPTIDGSLLLT